MTALLLAALAIADVAALDDTAARAADERAWQVLTTRLSLFRAPPADRAPLDPGLAQLAREAHRSGEDAHARGEWRAAFRHFQRAYRLSADPNLWFNMGLALRHFAPEDAYGFLLEYLNSPAEIADRVAVIRLIARVRNEADAFRAGAASAQRGRK